MVDAVVVHPLDEGNVPAVLFCIPCGSTAIDVQGWVTPKVAVLACCRCGNTARLQDFSVGRAYCPEGDTVLAAARTDIATHEGVALPWLTEDTPAPNLLDEPAEPATAEKRPRLIGDILRETWVKRGFPQTESGFPLHRGASTPDDDDSDPGDEGPPGAA